MQRLTARVYGSVQGVGYRAFAQRAAKQLGLTGYARNCADGTVEVVAEGELALLLQFLEMLQRGPSSARVSQVANALARATGEYHDFEIRD
ncbi:MAG: acylphosphatase [Fimbriimonadales bacterium]|nr:MAG: acylphosphatase [Fimbriimonadales bacterium]